MVNDLEKESSFYKKFAIFQNLSNKPRYRMETHPNGAFCATFVHHYFERIFRHWNPISHIGI